MLPRKELGASFAFMGFITAFSRRNSTYGVKALNVGDGRKRSTALMICCLEQEPRNCCRIGCIGAFEHSTNNRATVSSLPGWTSEVCAHQLPATVQQIGLRGGKCPDITVSVVRIFFTGVNLNTAGMQIK